MLKYISTRDEGKKVLSAEAVLDGLAPDGGLFVPDNLKDIRLDYKEVIKNDYRGMAKAVFSKFFPDYGEKAIGEIVEKSYKNKFTVDEIAPLVPVGDSYILELFHGPTCAFKDVALSVLPNLMMEAAKKENFTDEILILTATSGDTGSAALHGFSNVPGTRIIVFYPDGGISETQRLQMVTEPGLNTSACGVRGNFDDAQNGVKNIFGDIPHPVKGVSLSSANSINIGRLVPQIVYYYAAYKSLVDMKRISLGDEVDYTVPTGNFGDIMAGYFAKQMGLPVGKLICASNKNDVLTEFLETGHYDRKRDFYKTASPSMDILVSSNLERLLYYVCGTDNTKKYMNELREKGEYTISKDELKKIKESFFGVSCDDEDGDASIKDVFDNDKYLMDTHTAIAWSAKETCQKDGISDDKTPNVVLSTASPYKFTRAVLKALGKEPLKSDKENLLVLSEITGTMIPRPLAKVFELEVKHKDIIDVNQMKEYVIKNAEK